jgi:3-oxoacyl-[acyl-carrier protein] reductase
MTEEHWDTVMALNLKSVFLCSRAAVRRMLPRKRGVVVFLASDLSAPLNGEFVNRDLYR